MRLSLSQLRTFALNLEGKAGASTAANDSFTGYWKRTAAAAESIAGASTAANESVEGYQLRIAKALEVTSGTTGAEENQNEAGYLKRITDALEVRAGQSYTGTIANRIVLASAAATFGGGPPDVVADAFSFTDATDVALSSTQTSNTITVAGLGSGVSVAVSVTGGTYSKNGGAYTSAAGTATNGDTFAVRHTASASNSVAANTTLTVGGVSDTFTSTTLAAAAEPPAAPTIVWTSASNVYDPTFTITGIAQGDVVTLEIDDSSGFGSLYGSDTNTVDVNEAADGLLSFPAIPTLVAPSATTYYARAKITRAGLTSVYSTTVSRTMDAIVVSAAKLVIGSGSTGAGVDRSQYINSTDGLLATMNNNIGAPCLIKSAEAPPAKFHVEATISGYAARIYVGVTDAARAVGPSVFTSPGSGGNGAGLTIQLEAGNATANQTVFVNGGSSTVTMGAVPATSQAISLDVDTTSNTVVVRHKVGGTVTTVGTYVLTTQIPTNWRPFVGGSDSGDSITFNAGSGGAFAITPLTGHVGY